jgi:acyl dehydratase
MAARHQPEEKAMRVFVDFDAVKAAVGEELGTSDWVVVSQERIDRFAEATGDDQWIHVDVERARRELPYGTTIAHGLLTLSLLPIFFRSVLRIEGVRNSLNYGSDRVRYLAPVPAGSRLRGRIAIARAVEASPNALRVTYHTTVEIEGGDRPACVADTIGVHFR